MKEWELARDINKRAERIQLKMNKRFASWSTEYYGPVAESGPLVRTPLFEGVELMPDSLAWHKRRVMGVFNELDVTETEEVGIDQLEESFSRLQVPIDSQTFTLYASMLLPVGTDYVSREEFLRFHQVVWANQPASVRRFAGDPCFAGGTESPAMLKKPMARSSSMPTMGASLKEIRDNESRLRTAFKRYESNPGFLSRKHLPAVFQDIGLDPGISTDLGFRGSNRLNTFLTKQLKKPDVDEGINTISVHDVIEIQNRYIAQLESTPSWERTSSKFVAPKYLPALDSPSKARARGLPESGEVDEAAMQREVGLQDRMIMCDRFSDLVNATDSLKPDRIIREDLDTADISMQEEDPIQAKARKALERVMLGRVDPDDPELDESKERARNALMSVFDDIDEDDIELRARARKGMESALLGIDPDSAELEDSKERARNALMSVLDDVDEEEIEQRAKAREALSYSLFGMSSEELDAEEAEEDEQRAKARLALSRSILGMDAEEAEEEETRDRARMALERSLLGSDAEEDEFEESKERARDALAAAMDLDENGMPGASEESKERARDALAAAMDLDENGMPGPSEESKERARNALQAAMGDLDEES